MFDEGEIVMLYNRVCSQNCLFVYENFCQQELFLLLWINDFSIKNLTLDNELDAIPNYKNEIELSVLETHNPLTSW